MRAFLPTTSLGLARFWRPGWVSIEDRADGTIWYLTHNVAEERFSITDVPPSRKQRLSVRHFGAYDGPYLPVDRRSGLILRLLIRGGRFGYEVIDNIQGLADLASATITTRRGNGRLTLAVQQGTFQEAGDAIGYRVVRDD